MIEAIIVVDIVIITETPNRSVPIIPFDKPIPATENHIHFGGGQTETVISLAKGPHTLQLLLGDAYHIPLNPVLLSEKITIYVIEQNN